MIYVFEGGSVVYDGSTLTEEQKAEAVAVEALPEPEKIEGKYAQIRADKTAGTVYYEYIDLPKDPEVEQLKQVVADLTELVLFGGAE
jgi:hypothetical protein